MAHPLFSALLQEEVIPPASSDGIMHFLRALMTAPASIPGKFMILQSVSKCAASVKCEADGMGAALSQNMIDTYYERFNDTVARVLSLAQLQKTVLGFNERAAARQFVELKAAALQLCPTYVHPSNECGPIRDAHNNSRTCFEFVHVHFDGNHK